MDVDEMMEALVSMKKRVQNVEAQLRAAHGKISTLERKVNALVAEIPEGSVTDDDQPELFDWEEEG